jgi:hypothetical protein
LPWKANNVEFDAPVNVPQTRTFVAGPIWPAPVPQLAELLNQAGVCGAVAQFPCGLPFGVM